MSVNDILQQVMMDSVAQFIPSAGWFDGQEEEAVWVSGFRVHRVPLGGRLAAMPMQMDFDQVRAVFVDLKVPYPNFLVRLNPRPDGNVKDGTKLVGWETTETGVILLLITPFPSEEGDEAWSEEHNRAEEHAWERLSLARSIIVATLGRNAAYEQLFGTKLELGSGNISHRHVIEHPMSFPPPALEPPALRLMLSVAKTINFAEEGKRNRVRLALR